jgi:glycosyltransferase involved in cell wall biosynthesis
MRPGSIASTAYGTLSASIAYSDEQAPDPAHLRSRLATQPAGCKLAVVIPAFNEAKTIGAVVASVPRRIPQVREVEVIVVDDGSSDGTAMVALDAGADHIERHRSNRGLVASFRDGMNSALASGADVVVHLDGDGQHDPGYIPRLVAPILFGEADVVVGVRPLDQASEISQVRRRGNQIGSWVFRRLMKMPISDATSGYRAFSREAVLRLNVISEYTYTLETLIRSARMRLAVAEVVVPALPRAHGESRMTRSVTRYVGHAGGQAFRTMLHTNPLTLFGRAALAMLALSAVLTGWFLLGYQSGGMHLPALLAAVLTFVLAVGLFVSGLIADGISTSHRLLEDVLYHLKRVEHDRFEHRLPVDTTEMETLEAAATRLVSVGSR